MRQFKLKQWYPSLPKDWQVGMIVGQGDRGAYGDYSPCAGNYSNKYVSFKDVETNPEYWQKTEEKDFEILSLCTNSYFGITKSSIDIEAFLNKEGTTSKYTIKSVKRLSDGEVFSIGDRYMYTSGDSQVRTIQGIVLREDSPWLQFDLNNPNYGNTLEYAVKAKPLFTSTDGFPMFIGDTYYVPQRVSKEYSGTILELKVDRFTDPSDPSKRFKFKERAEGVVKLYKKEYPLYKVVEAVNNWSMSPVDENSVLKFLAENE